MGFWDGTSGRKYSMHKRILQVASILQSEKVACAYCSRGIVKYLYVIVRLCFNRTSDGKGN